MKSSDEFPVWLGIDLGTQSVRAIAVSETGEMLGSGVQSLTSHRDGKRHEQNPDDWWKATVGAVRTTLESVPGERVAGLAVDGTSGTILLIDARDHPLTPGLMYDDGRATDEAALATDAGAELWAELGYNRMQAPWGLPKLLWLLRYHHEMIHPGVRFAHQTDFINARLMGHPAATDTSNALKSGCDLLRTEWPQEIFERLEIPAYLLPHVMRPGSRLGEVCAAAARECGLPEHTPVFAGMTDGCAAQIGAGALRVGSWNSVLGTTLVLKGVTRDLLKDPAGVLYSHRSPDGHWLPGGASSTGAGAISQEFAGRDLDALAAQAIGRGPSANVVYPLAGKGERFPFHAPAAEGFTIGEPCDEIDRFAGILQGVAFIERLCFDYLGLLGAPTDGDLFLTGGGAKSCDWSQLRADILGRSVRLPENPEAALGMAVLAAASSSGQPLAEVSAEMVRIRETIDPRPVAAARYREPYLQLVEELERRVWLPPSLARQARENAR